MVGRYRPAKRGKDLAEQRKTFVGIINVNMEKTQGLSTGPQCDEISARSMAPLDTSVPHTPAVADNGAGALASDGGDGITCTSPSGCSKTWTADPLLRIIPTDRTWPMRVSLQ